MLTHRHNRALDAGWANDCYVAAGNSFLPPYHPPLVVHAYWHRIVSYDIVSYRITSYRKTLYRIVLHRIALSCLLFWKKSHIGLHARRTTWYNNNIARYRNVHSLRRELTPIAYFFYRIKASCRLARGVEPSLQQVDLPFILRQITSLVYRCLFFIVDIDIS